MNVFLDCLGPHLKPYNRIAVLLSWLFGEQGGEIHFEGFTEAIYVVNCEDYQKVHMSFLAYDFDRKGYVTAEDIHLIARAHFDVIKEMMKSKLLKPKAKDIDQISDSFRVIIGEMEKIEGYIERKLDISSDDSDDDVYDDAIWDDRESIFDLISMRIADDITNNAFEIIGKSINEKMTEEDFFKWASLDRHAIKWMDYAKDVFATGD